MITCVASERHWLTDSLAVARIAQDSKIAQNAA